jgi:DNA polymerase I-like protein with 3'-5' exonuclease and polymerase domains
MTSSNSILTREALDEAVEYFMQYDAFAFDVETMGDNRGVPTRNQVVWIALATYGRTIVIPMGHPNGNKLLRKATRKKNKVTGKFDPIPALYDEPPEQLRPSEVFDALKPLFFSDRIKIAHNATFDLISVTKYFGEVPPPGYHCTMVLQWLLNENLRSKGLKEVTEKDYGVKYDHENVGRCIEAHPFWKVAHYSFMDTKYTWLRWVRLWEIMKRSDLMNVFRLEEDTLGVLLDMGLEGAPIDVARLEDLKVEMSDRLVDIEARIYRAAGQKFNINSTPQKAEVLWGSKDEGGQGLKPKVLTDGGMKKDKAGRKLELADYSTSAEVLELYVGNPVVDGILEYAEVNKLLGTYVLGYLGVEDDPKKPAGSSTDDPRRPGAVRTVTGRFSCREPNLQNIPRPTPNSARRSGAVHGPPGLQVGRRRLRADRDGASSRTSPGRARCGTGSTTASTLIR